MISYGKKSKLVFVVVLIFDFNIYNGKLVLII